MRRVLRRPARGVPRARRSGELSLNCLVLLDGCDSELGRRFLTEFAAGRADQPPDQAFGPPPLTVVAASRGTLLADRESGDIARAVHDDDQPAPQSWAANAVWARRRLADLGADDIGRALGLLVHREGDETQLKEMLAELSGGHPASVGVLIEALARHPEHWREPASLLDVPMPGAEPGSPDAGRTVEQGLVRRLLGRTPEPGEEFDDLMICAAATQRRHALYLCTGEQPLVAGGLAGFEADIEPVLWPTAPELLRRLLLRGLALHDAARLPDIQGLPDGPTDPVAPETAGTPLAAGTTWSSAFGRLRKHLESSGNIVDELYYTLALGGLADVARRLDALVGDREKAEIGAGSAAWIALLESVATAPRRVRNPEAVAKPPMEQLRSLIAAARFLDEPHEPLGRDIKPLAELVAARWIVADPFLGNRRRGLHLHIARGFEGLIARWQEDSDPLFDAAQRHRREANNWA
ncbi:hypothetical protein ACFQ9X_24870 [Catenulispora yoronensis]